MIEIRDDVVELHEMATIPSFWMFQAALIMLTIAKGVYTHILQQIGLVPGIESPMSSVLSVH